MRSIIAVSFSILFLLFHSIAFSQNLRLQQVTHAGVVKSVSGSMIQFESDSGRVRAECLLPSGNRQQLALSEFGSTRINVRGHESIKFLKKGMTIRFEAEVSRGVRIPKPIKEVTLITRHNFTQLGMQSLGDGLPDRRDGDAGKDQEADDAIEKNDEDDVKRSDRNSAEKMVITGVVNFVDEEKFRVEIPDTRRGRRPRRLTANWDEDPVVRIDAQELAYIQPEDRITVVGYVIRGLDVMATSVEVEHVNPDVAAPEVKEGDDLPKGRVFPQNDPLEKGFGDNNAVKKDGMNKNEADAESKKAAGGRKPKKNRSPGRVFKIN